MLLHGNATTGNYDTHRNANEQKGKSFAAEEGPNHIGLDAEALDLNRRQLRQRPDQ